MYCDLLVMVTCVALKAAPPQEPATPPAQKDPVAHWKFNGNSEDWSNQKNHGRAFGVNFGAAGRSGKPGTAAAFDGVESCIEVPDSASLHFGTGDFSIAAWIKLPEGGVDDVVGDLLSKFDDGARRGFNFYIKASSATYNSRGDINVPIFGIDDGKESPWEDCGKLWPSNMYVSSLTVFNGNLYGGIANALKDEEACHVFRYGGGTKWEDCGRVGDSPRHPVRLFHGRPQGRAVLRHRGATTGSPPAKRPAILSVSIATRVARNGRIAASQVKTSAFFRSHRSRAISTRGPTAFTRQWPKRRASFFATPVERSGWIADDWAA